LKESTRPLIAGRITPDENRGYAPPGRFFLPGLDKRSLQILIAEIDDLRESRRAAYAAAFSMNEMHVILTPNIS
jgi:hypothetical protein